MYSLLERFEFLKLNCAGKSLNLWFFFSDNLIPVVILSVVDSFSYMYGEVFIFFSSS